MTTLTMLKASPTLNLLPKRYRAKKEAYGRLQQDPLDSVRDEAAAGLD